MWITRILFGKQALPRKLFSGKHRIPRKVLMHQKEKVLSDLVREEENLFYLRQPYLTPDQEKISPRTSEQQLQRINRIKERDLAKLTLRQRYNRDHVILEERLQHLKVNEKWD